MDSDWAAAAVAIVIVVAVTVYNVFCLYFEYRGRK